MSAREWKPGDVAMVNQRGAFEHIVSGAIIIDPAADEDALEPIWIALRDGRALQSRANLHAALRSLLAPPKPEEPTGLGAVVEDAEGRKWVRTGQPYPWSDLPDVDEDGDGTWESRNYDDLAAVRVLSEGVQP